ncbi:MAG: Tetratricopeptide 1 repeat-containing protein [Flaviaesturariibacter sp.]|nr:Tetratricopeptide 1 repeat-containing protein [Flaviaesturariibacter sp.]
MVQQLPESLQPLKPQRMKYLLLLVLGTMSFVSNAQSADEFYEKGRKAYESKDYKASIDYYTRSIELTPTGNAYWGRASAAWQLSLYAKAVTDYSVALLYVTDTKERGKLLINRADVYFDMADYRAAIAGYRSYLELIPAQATAYNQLGRCYLLLNRTDSAVESFNNAALVSTVTADKAIYTYNKGIAYRNALNYPAAEANLTACLALDALYDKAYVLRADMYTARRKYALAVADYDHLLSLGKSDLVNAVYYHARGLVYSKMKQSEQAFADVKKAADLAPDNEDYWFDLGDITKNRLRNAALADGFFRKAMALAAAADSNSTYGYASLLAGDTKEAFRFQARKIAQAKSDPYRYKWELHNMACFYALTGDTGKGIDYVQRSLAAGFDDFHHLVNDRDLEPLMGLPAYKALLTRYKVPVPQR